MKLHGSYRYLSERGIDFDKILRTYEADDDNREESKGDHPSSDFQINLYELSDDGLDSESDESEFVKSEDLKEIESKSDRNGLD